MDARSRLVVHSPYAPADCGYVLVLRVPSQVADHHAARAQAQDMTGPLLLLSCGLLITLGHRSAIDCTPIHGAMQCLAIIALQ